jgi:hypothetical protein
VSIFANTIFEAMKPVLTHNRLKYYHAWQMKSISDEGPEKCKDDMQVSDKEQAYKLKI